MSSEPANIVLPSAPVAPVATEDSVIASSSSTDQNPFADPHKKSSKSIRSSAEVKKWKKYLICFLIIFLILLIIIAVIVFYRLFILLTKKKHCPPGYSLNDCSLECGIVYTPSSFSRIIGGYHASKGSWPSIALVVSVSKKGTFICGGTLIDKDTVLTAAHCIVKSVKPQASMYHVILGANSIKQAFTQNATDNDFQKFDVKKIIVHEKFEPKEVVYDIAIIKLGKPAQLTKNVQVACLPQEATSTYPLNQQVYAVGYGTTSYNKHNTTNQLNYVNLQMYSMTKCYWARPHENFQICAGDLKGERDTCSGDSGGPLYVLDSIEGKLKYVSVGIVSYGHHCALPNKPSIYTRNSYFLDWIRENS